MRNLRPLCVVISALAVCASAHAAAPGRARQLHYFNVSPSTDTMIESLAGSIYLATTSAECAPYTKCLRFADPALHTYNTGLFQASIITRLIYIEYPSTFWIALGLV